MLIRCELPYDRLGNGKVWIEGEPTAWRCRGKADNAMATTKGNPHRSPVRPFGDHPAGRSKVVEVRKCRPEEAHSYGPWKLVLLPVEGEVLQRENAEPGPMMLELHGGDIQNDGVSLRATYGCLRLDNATADILARRVQSALAAGEEVWYECAIAG